MNNLVANFDQILDFAGQYGLPTNKKRGIIREYLQAKFISYLYSLKDSEKLSFVGGTSLRLLRNFNRFSEDLDFDNLGLSDLRIKNLIEKVVFYFKQENIEVELICVQKGYKNYFELRFPKLLKELKISTDPREKLKVKIDYASFWQGQNPESIFFRKYGFLEQVLSNPLDQLLVQKLTSYVRRKQTQPRDIYDIVCLYSLEAKLDLIFMKANCLVNLLNLAKNKYAQEGISLLYQRKLAPFLFKKEDVKKMDLFAKVLAAL